jgi:hypothetical protein
MREVKSLEERIREKARIELKNQIDAAAQPLALFTHFGYSVELKELVHAAGQNGQGRPVQVWEAIGFVKERIFAELVNKREDDAIAEFIHKVDELQAQVDELKSLGVQS